MKYDKNPVDGNPLKQSDLIKLELVKNDVGDYIDPVTLKAFTDNSHIVAVRHGGSANVFFYDTIERLNFKPRMWRDLVTDEEFSRNDIITLQDPHDLRSRNLSSFRYIQDGEGSGIETQAAGINAGAMGSSARILHANEAVVRARAERTSRQGLPSLKQSDQTAMQTSQMTTRLPSRQSESTPFNTSHRTTGQAAASLTSTGLTPHTSATLASLSDEEYLLKPGRVRQKGYIRLRTSLGDMTIELYPEYAPKACWNFVKLTQKRYYDGILFHRNIRNFMIQTGDPSGTGRGGTSIWGKPFQDELNGPLKHDTRGTVSMANKGRNTNTSQFFVAYRAATHLDRKHTIFGKVVEGLDVLKALEEAPVDSHDRPIKEIKLLEAICFLDPFEEFLKQQQEVQEAEKEKRTRRGDDPLDDRTTWTGKRIRDDGSVEEKKASGVGKYLKKSLSGQGNKKEGRSEDWSPSDVQRPPQKKAKTGGEFGNFASW